MISAVLFISFFVFLILGVPIALCLGLSSVCAILYSGTSLTIVATNMYSGISKFLLLAIPFFVLSGNIMAKAGISRRLIDFVDTCVGHKKGGIAIVCVIVSCFFGAISGSGPATVAALGAVLIPAMVEQGGFTHAVISAHRGLPSASLFTDLDQMKVGDHFLLHVLDETLCYEVDKISVVKPEDTSALAVEDGQDLVTLLTCTPYGVNTERLLVRGHRVPYVEEEVKEEKTVLSGSSLHTNYLLWVFVGLSVTALFVFVLYLKETKLKRRANKGGKK